MVCKFTATPKKTAFTIIESLVFIVVSIFLLIGIYFSKQLIKANDVKSLIAQIKKYDAAVNSFTDKYQALPGDIHGTIAFGITENNTDGNGDNILTDRARKIFSGNGEITNFWMHLSKTKMIDENFDGKENEKAKIGSTFPISRIGDKIGIIAYSDDGKTYYQVGLKLVSKDRIFMTDESLKTDEAYWFDKKLDDGNPKKGRVVAAGETLLNITENDKCVKFSNYDKSNAQASCQLRITIE